MSSTKLYLDCRNKARDGKGTLVVSFSHNHTSTTFSLGIRVHKKNWDGKSVVGTPDAKILNAVIAQKKGDIDKAILIHSLDKDFPWMTASEVKALLRRDAEKKANLNIHSGKHLISDVFKDYMATEMEHGTRVIYQSALNKVNLFAGKDAYIEDIDLKWLYRFESFLAQSQSVNGRAIYLRDLRTICNYAKNSGIITTYPFSNFSIKLEPTRKRNITLDKLHQLYHFEVSEKIQEYKDFLFLMLYLIGIDACDLFLAKHSNIVNGRLEYVRKKTHKKYSIKIEPEAQVILDKYSGTEFLLNVRDRVQRYQSYLRKMNDGLKTIGPVMSVCVPSDELFQEERYVEQISPIVNGITSKWARHTWATLAYEAGISIDIISQALGHSINNKTTLIYIKYDQEKVDRANRTVIDYVTQMF